jgi:hypothetical protein
LSSSLSGVDFLAQQQLVRPVTTTSCEGLKRREETLEEVGAWAQLRVTVVEPPVGWRMLWALKKGRAVG